MRSADKLCLNVCRRKRRLPFLSPRPASQLHSCAGFWIFHLSICALIKLHITFILRQRSPWEPPFAYPSATENKQLKLLTLRPGLLCHSFTPRADPLKPSHTHTSWSLSSMAFSFSNVGAGGGEKKTGTLFGSTTAPAGGLFGQSQQQQTQQPNATGSSLFGSTATPQSNNSNSLFGSAQPQQQNNGSSLFGQPQQQNTGSSLFGQPQQQQQQQNAGSSLFGQPQQQGQQQGQQPQQQPNMGNSLFGTSLQPAPILNNVQAQSIQQQREGLPQLRQSSAQPFAGSTITGHSMDTPNLYRDMMLTRRRGKVGRRADTDS